MKSSSREIQFSAPPAMQGGALPGTVRAAANAVRATAAQYDGLLSRQPFRTSTVTGAILGWAGDALTKL
jgi:hypothetical protein